MPKFPEPCVICGKVTTFGSRCPLHRAEYEAKRNGKPRNAMRRQAKSELYNYAYRKAAKEIKATATHCAICMQPFVEGDRVEADHIIPGDNFGGLRATHRLCNQRRGNKPLA